MKFLPQRSNFSPKSLILFLIALFFPFPVFAQPQPWNANPNLKCVDPNNPDVPYIKGLECLFYNILQVIVVIAGLTFFAMFVTGGFQYLLSGGDQKKVAAAASTLTSSVIGLVGIIGSYLILVLIQHFTGITNLTKFTIPGP